MNAAASKDGLTGSTVAGRRDDNVVVTSGAPFSREDIGFNGVGGQRSHGNGAMNVPLAAPNRLR